MGVLTNPRHERFAQERAKGSTADEAYASAGFTRHRGNAARLSADESIAERVSELLANAAEKTEITVAALSARLMNLVRVAEVTGIEKDEAGAPKKSSSRHLNVARAAVMDAAKLNGLVVDKADITATVTLEKLILGSMSDADLDAALSEPGVFR